MRKPEPGADGRRTNRRIATVAFAAFAILVVAVAIWSMLDRDLQSIDATPMGETAPGSGAMEQTADPAPAGSGARPDNPVATE